MADQLLKLEIVAPDHQALSIEASSVVVRSPEGELGFLPNHIALISALVPQIVRYKDEAGHEDRIFVSGGFVEVNNNHVVILTPAAEKADEIDFERARHAEERARERLMNGRDNNIDVGRAEVALRRATERLKLQKYL